jgi:hypothetical protein
MQTVLLTGVLDDGNEIQPRVPLDTAKTIQLPLLSPITIEVSVVYNTGIPVDLAASSPVWNSWFTVVKNPCSCEQASGVVDYQLASTTRKTHTRSTIVFAIPSTAFLRFPAGRYFYDVSLSFDGVKYQIVRISGLHLEAVLRRA